MRRGYTVSQSVYTDFAWCMRELDQNIRNQIRRIEYAERVKKYNRDRIENGRT